jgi:hypothetical protein
MQVQEIWDHIITFIDYHPTFFLLMSTSKTIKGSCEKQVARFGKKEIRRIISGLDIKFYSEGNKLLFERFYRTLNKEKKILVLEEELNDVLHTTFWPEKYTRNLVHRSIPFSVGNTKKKVTLNLFSACTPKEVKVKPNYKSSFHYCPSMIFDRERNLIASMNVEKGEEYDTRGKMEKTWSKGDQVLMIVKNDVFHLVSLQFPTQKVTFKFTPYSSLIDKVEINGETLDLNSKNQKKIKKATSDPVFLLAIDLLKPSNHCYLGVKKEEDVDVCFECGLPLGPTFVVDHDIKFHILCIKL